MRRVFLGVCLFYCISDVGAQQLSDSAAGDSRAGQTGTKDVPHQVHFGGVLWDASGSPLRGLQGVTFALYSEQTGGAPLWVETQNVTADAQGRFDVLLGSERTDGVPQDVFTSNAAHWLGVRANVAGAEEQARVLLLSVPYALKAADAETLGGKPLSAFVLTAGSDKAAIKPKAGAAASATDGGGGVSANSTAGQIAKFIDAVNNVGDSIITESSGKIGVGTNSPQGALDVGGWAGVPGDITGVTSTIGGDAFVGNTGPNIGRVRLASNANAGFFSFNQYYNGTGLKGMDPTGPGWFFNIGGKSTSDAFFVQRAPATAGFHVPATLLYLNNAGRLGLGTTAPQGTLDVGGWSGIPGDIVGVGTTVNGDSFIGNAGPNVGRVRLASNGAQGFLSWNQYYNGTGLKGMDPAAPGWFLNLGGNGGADAFSVQRSPATAGFHVPAILFHVNNVGNVGIGTSAPTELLQVASGNVKVTGTVGVNGYIFPDGTKQTSAVTANTTNVAIRGINYLGGCDTCGVLTDADDQKTIYVNVIGPQTIASVTCFSDAGTPTINLQRDDGSPANILSADLACSTAGATTTTFVGGETILNLNDRVDFVMVSSGGVAKRVTVAIKAVVQ